MAIYLPDNIFSNSPKPIEGKYLSLEGIPYISTDQVTSSIDINYRYKGLTVLVSSSVAIAEYWWKDGTADNQLILKTAGAGPFLTTASNVNNGNTLTISKSDGSSYQIVIDTGSGQTYIQGPGITIGGNNAISASLGAGLEFNGNNIQAQVRTVNGVTPDITTGNITTALTAVLTGPSASGTNNLIASSSGPNTGSITNGTVWVVSGDSSTPDPDGLAYIFVSQSADVGGAGKWFPLSTLNQDQADLRYVKLNSGGASTPQTITSSLLISGSNLTVTSSFKVKGDSTFDGANTITGSLTISGSSPLTINGGTNLITGSLIVSNSLNIVGTNRITGSIIASGSTPLTVIGGTSTLTGSLIVSNSLDVIGTNRITGSLIVSNSLDVIGTNRITGSLIVSSSSQIIGTETITGSLIISGSETITGSLIVSSSSQIIGTETITGSLIVSNSSNVIGTSRVTGSLIVSNSSQIIGTETITGSLTVSGSTPLTVVGGTSTLSGSFFVSGGLIFAQNISLNPAPGMYNGIHYITTTGTTYASFVADQNNNVFFQATGGGDIWVRSGTKAKARFRDTAGTYFGNEVGVSSWTLAVLDSGPSIQITGSTITSGSLSILPNNAAPTGSFLLGRTTSIYTMQTSGTFALGTGGSGGGANGAFSYDAGTVPNFTFRNPSGDAGLVIKTNTGGQAGSNSQVLIYPNVQIGHPPAIAIGAHALAYNHLVINSGSNGTPNIGIGTATPLSSYALTVSGAAFFSNILTLTPISPLPASPATGSFAVSASTPPRPYFWDGTNWNPLY